MGFFIWMGHPKRQRRAGALFIAWMAALGVIYEATATANAGTFINQAQSGADLGNTLLLGGQTDAAGNAGGQEMQGFAGTQPAGVENNASSYYLSDNVGLTPGNALNQASAANTAVLSDPTCPAGWPGPLNQFQQQGMGAVASTQNACKGPLQAAATSLTQAMAGTSGSTLAAYQGAQQSIQAFGQELSQVNSAGNALETTCAPVINGYYQYAPACNLLSVSGVPSLGTLAAAWAGPLGTVASGCAALPTAITSPAAAQGLENALSPLTADLQGIIGGATGSVYANGNGDGAAILAGGYGSGAVTAASQEYQQIYGQCSYAQSYLENISTYPGGMNAYASDPMLNNFLSNPSNQGMINKMMPFIESNPNVFSQYYQNVACTNNNTNITNAGTSATGPSTTTTSAPSIQSSPVACTQPLSAYTSTGWIDAADWPDPNAQWIYGTSGGCGAGVPNGTTDLMEGVYSNTTGAPLNATLYLAADDAGVVDINGTQVATYSDGGQGGDGAQAYPSTGGVVSVPITLSPGPDQIMYYITNAGGGTAANPSSGILTIIGTVNGTSQVLIDTNSNWVYIPQNAAQAGSTVTVNPGSVTTNTTPNTHAQSILCNSPIQCMGTECHALFGNQDLQFSQALTALSALQQMEQGAVCATGTSMAAGNCQPIIFGGDARYCRTWPAGGSFTNNCCAEGLKDAGQAGNLANYLLLAHDTWRIANSPLVDAHVWGMGAFHGWVENAYSTMDKWAAQGWGYVTSAFKGASEAISNAFGFGGAAASNAVGVSSTAVQGGTQAATSGLITTMEATVESWLWQAAAYLLNVIFGPQMAAEILTAMYNFVTSVYYQDIAMFFSVIGWIYLVYQILQIVANMLTACKNEEFKLGQKRKLHACQNLGTYCADSFMGFCLEHKDVFCCYASPLSRIIAAQIKIGQPNVAGGYGTPQDPQCGGFTVQQLAAVDWSQVSLAQWQAMLQSAGLIAGGNAAGSAIYTPAQIDHPAGDVNIQQAPIPVGHPPVVTPPASALPTGNPNAVA